jgi:hypothetical protein
MRVSEDANGLDDFLCLGEKLEAVPGVSGDKVDEK